MARSPIERTQIDSLPGRNQSSCCCCCCPSFVQLLITYANVAGFGFRKLRIHALPSASYPLQIGCLFTHVTGCYCAIVTLLLSYSQSILYKSRYLRSLFTGYRFIGPITVTIRSECSVNSLIDLFSTRDRDSPACHNYG